MIDSGMQARRLAELEQQAGAAADRLRDTSIALLEANQRLAQIPLLEHRLQEVWDAREWYAQQNEALERENAALREENRRLSEGLPPS